MKEEIPNEEKVVDGTLTGSSKKRKRRKTKESKRYADCTDPESSEGETYVVESIIDKRNKSKSGPTEYLIKWYGWPTSANTWEPAKNLAGCKWMVQKFEENQRKQLLSSTTIKTEFKSELFGDQEYTVSGGYVCGVESKKGYTPVPRNARSADLAKLEDREVFRKKDLYEGVLDKCPESKSVKAIHGVTVVEGFLTFIVQWKSGDKTIDEDPGFNDSHCNMVLAQSMNEKFPQDVIAFYEKHVKLITDKTSEELERKCASEALDAAKTRHEEMRRKVIKLMEPDDSDDYPDAATSAIERDRRKRDKFNPQLSDSEISDMEEEFYGELDVEILN